MEPPGNTSINADESARDAEMVRDDDTAYDAVVVNDEEIAREAVPVRVPVNEPLKLPVLI